jgi:hypothetical protein
MFTRVTYQQCTVEPSSSLSRSMHIDLSVRFMQQQQQPLMQQPLMQQQYNPVLQLFWYTESVRTFMTFVYS